MKKLKIYPSVRTQRHFWTGLGRDRSVALQASIRWRRPLRQRSSDLGKMTIPTLPSSSSSSRSSSSSSVRSRCCCDRDHDCRSQFSSTLLLISPSIIRASRCHLASRDGASRPDRIRPSASRGGRFFQTVNNDDVKDNKYNIFCHNGIINTLRCCNCAASSAVVVVQVIFLVINSISMAPRIRARNSKTINSLDKTTIPISSLYVTNVTDSIDGIDVRG